MLSHPAVSTAIRGMGEPSNVERNVLVGDGEPFHDEVLAKLAAHRWDLNFSE